MPSIAKDYEMTVRGHIRRLLIMDGGMTDIELHKQLQEIGIPFGIEFVRKQRRKILKEKMQKGLSYTLTTYLQHFIDTLSEADRKLWQIASSKSEPAGVRTYALSQIRENRKAVFDKLFEAGIFEKQLGNLNLRTFMDIVKDATNPNGNADTTTPGNPGPLALESGGSNPSPLGQGLADLVRAAGNPPVDSPPPEDGRP